MHPHKAYSENNCNVKAPLTSYLGELWQFRELFCFFIRRDFNVRYRQALLGFAWVIIRPLLNMAMFSFIFGQIARFPSSNVNYAAFVLSGLVAWQFVANVLNDACYCLRNNAVLITKCYFPRLLIPMSQMSIHVLEFSINLSVVLILGLFLDGKLSYNIITLPLFFSLVVMFSLGINVVLSVLSVRFKDIPFLVGFFIQFGMFLSPVGYGTFMIPEKYIWIYALNPIVGIIDGFRWCLFDAGHAYFPYTLIYSMVVTGLLLIGGLAYFRKSEQTIVDNL